MKSLVKIYNLDDYSDVVKIKNIVSNYEGILACEISLSKKEINLVYDNLSVEINDIVNSIEMAGYIVL